MEQYLRKRWHDFDKGVWDLRLRARTRKLAPTMNSASLQQAVKHYAPNAATDCLPTTASPKRTTVTVTAKRDAPDFDIHINSGNKSFKLCVSRKIQKQLRSSFSASRQRQSGKYERFFRIDNDASATHTFNIETPQAREERRKKLREEQDRHRYEF